MPMYYEMWKPAFVPGILVPAQYSMNAHCDECDKTGVFHVGATPSDYAGLEEYYKEFIPNRVVNFTNEALAHLRRKWYCAHKIEFRENCLHPIRDEAFMLRSDQVDRIIGNVV